MTTAEHLDVIVIGAGQAGLAAGYYLKRSGARFAIFDAAERVGDSWRKRWDSLRLFTPARFTALPGLALPGAPQAFPSKNELADYLESYARKFELPLRLGVRVERISKTAEHFSLRTSAGFFSAGQVVVAMGPYQNARVPGFARELDRDIFQLHSSEYRRPEQLPSGPVLVVGAGNSGAEIALDLTRAGRGPVVLAGRETGHVPFAIDGLAARLLLSWLVLRVMFHHVLTISNPIGRRARRKLLGRAAPWIRSKPADLERARIRRAGRMVGVAGGLPQLEGGEMVRPQSVIWATGFERGFPWLDLPGCSISGEPEHEAGIALKTPGLYFLGLDFLFSMSSSMLQGVGRDAKRVISEMNARRARGEA